MASFMAAILTGGRPASRPDPRSCEAALALRPEHDRAREVFALRARRDRERADGMPPPKLFDVGRSGLPAVLIEHEAVPLVTGRSGLGADGSQPQGETAYPALPFLPPPPPPFSPPPPPPPPGPPPPPPPPPGAWPAAP